MPSQWAEKHECLFWSRSTGFSFRGARLSLPLLADAWGASGLPPDLCSLPACGTLELKMWLPITQPTPPLSHAPVYAHTPAHTHGCSQTLHPSCPTPPATASLSPATLCPPLPSSPAAAPPGPCHSHGVVTPPAAGGEESATARCPPTLTVSWGQCWRAGIKSRQGCPLFHLTQCSPDRLCWPFHSLF